MWMRERPHWLKVFYIKAEAFESLVEWIMGMRF